MTTFLNGPAIGQLSLSRAPLFLRATVDADGTVDALDQLDDEANPSEKIYVYHRAGEVTSGFACSRGKGCRTFQSAVYALYDVQPADEVLRDNNEWTRWAEAQAAKEEARPA